MCIPQDATAREQTMRSEESLLRTLIDHLPDLIYVKDLDSRILVVNQALAKLLGFDDPHQLVGKTDFDTYPREMAEKFFRCEQDILFSGTPMVDREAEIVDNHGNKRYVLSTKVPFSDRDGVPVGLVGIARDITERKLAEERLKQTLTDLSRSNTDLQQFAYVVSHDLKEPLRMVASFVRLLEKKYQDSLDNNAREYINFAVEGAERMKAFIDDLLLYSRVGRKDSDEELVDTAAVLDWTLQDFAAAIAESGAVVTAGDLPSIMIRRTQLMQVLQNLLGNAIKFSGEESPRVHLSAEERPDCWVFSVRDNGIGIDRQNQERIFEIFQRLHSREEYSGTGIGLAICKKIVERNRGEIWVESEPGKGATFYFTLPKPSTGGAGADKSGPMTKP